MSLSDDSKWNGSCINEFRRCLSALLFHPFVLKSCFLLLTFIRSMCTPTSGVNQLSSSSLPSLLKRVVIFHGFVIPLKLADCLLIFSPFSLCIQIHFLSFIDLASSFVSLENFSLQLFYKMKSCITCFV